MKEQGGKRRKSCFISTASSPEDAIKRDPRRKLKVFHKAVIYTNEGSDGSRKRKRRENKREKRKQQKYLDPDPRLEGS
ncbi:unnamed protein product [Acanthoscelides obtectus]|uniref:Uncharacterized protein n=1 Tax=Acanthoscelides obtectus TaxID=200917 RepID=A0A9P0JPE5_ACAOB|nr:unnamed protein product [Acanthoscelides obtectus]CAK1641337.1 hypothetical protein AOBTE_LOCUS12343 [Acanthoscelides obtectus]